MVVAIVGNGGCRSAEINELRENRRGWVNKSAAAKEKRASRLVGGTGEEGSHPVVAAAKPVKRTHKPKTTMDFERDWLRLPNQREQKMR